MIHVVGSRNLDEFLIMTGLEGSDLGGVIRKVALYAGNKKKFRRDMNRAIVLTYIMDLNDNLSDIKL